MTSAQTTPFVMAGDPSAAACVGDSCEIPPRTEQAVVNQRLDEDRI
ncbi:hypothetical protein [Conyzicola sp.]